MLTLSTGREKGEGEEEGSQFERSTNQEFQNKLNIFEHISQSSSTENSTGRILFHKLVTEVQLGR